MDEKRCTKCGEIKPLDAFHRQAGARDGHRPECKACNLARQAEKRAADPQPNRDRVREWHAANPERTKARMDRFTAAGKRSLSNRKSHLKRKYGLTLEEYDRMLAEQGGRCGICGRQPTRGVSLHVDHCHLTGRVRGILCFRCNNALGDFDHDTTLVTAAARYLQTAEEQQVRARATALKG